jgi:hypothetical protein
LIRVIHRLNLVARRVVVLRHFGSLGRLLGRTLHRLNHWRSGVE